MTPRVEGNPADHDGSDWRRRHAGEKWQRIKEKNEGKGTCQDCGNPCWLTNPRCEECSFEHEMRMKDKYGPQAEIDDEDDDDD